MNTIIYTVQIMNNKQKEDTATLEILQTIENQNDVTQRHIADRLDVALGLANSYLKRCVRKGLIKVQQAPANRYLYYLTPKGFAEKGRLTTAYLSSSFNFYRQASESLTHIYEECEHKKYSRILFCGISELMEIATVRALEHELNIMGAWDPLSNKENFINLPVWTKLDDIPDFDVCILTTLDKATDYYNLLNKNVDRTRIMVPSILDIGNQE